eukprot:210390-Pelagomonas_calceolata.AAC.9
MKHGYPKSVGQIKTSSSSKVCLSVSALEHLETAAGILGASPPVIGIDVEWRPTGGSGRASLMQVSKEYGRGEGKSQDVSLQSKLTACM